ncbi:MAG: S-layer homology domain-containing protein [Patescibacteria group bacterium]
MYPIRTAKPYNPANLAATGNAYTTVYLGNYLSGDYDENAGSHPGVDIVPMSPNDTVYSVLSGTVLVATSNPSEGNYVVIQHDNVLDPATGKKATYYSNYLHLSVLSVTKGQTVAEGDVIGKTGNTGQSTGEHLHFQIDVADAPFHPYWPFTFKDAQALGLGFMEAVNRGLGIENGQRYTVNPLVFLDRVGSSQPTPAVIVKPAEVHIATNVVSQSVAQPVIADVVVFSDVTPTTSYAPAIQFLGRAGVASGQAGKFFPLANVSRAEVLKMAFNAAKTPLSTDKATYFKDVFAGNAFLPYINKARELSVIGGYPDGTFRPNAPVTRAEGLKIILGILGFSPANAPAVRLSDVASSDWFAAYANWVVDNDALDTDNGFLPNQALTRGEVASIVYSVMN